MPLIFAAISSHSPLLIPSIGKNATALFTSTPEALKKMEEDLYALDPDTIFIISPHGHIQENTFSFNIHPKFQAEFSEFGDFATKAEFNCDIGLAHQIREHLETKAPLTMISDEKLDYGSSIPLMMLASKLTKTKIVPVSFSGLGPEAHFAFGQLLNREFAISPKKIALIASGDLSHALTKKSPAPYSPKGKKFDARLVEYLLAKDTESILNMEPDLPRDAKECGLKPILILLGTLAGMNYKPLKLSYEAPFGVGYLTMNFLM
jgi:MEMO1 family protein